MTATQSSAGAEDQAETSDGSCFIIGIDRKNVRPKPGQVFTGPVVFYVPAQNASYVDVWIPRVNDGKKYRGPVNEEFSIVFQPGEYEFQLAVELRTDNELIQCDVHRGSFTVKSEPEPPGPIPPPETCQGLIIEAEAACHPFGVKSLDFEECTWECNPPTCNAEELEFDAIVECGADNYELDLTACAFECLPPPPPTCDTEELEHGAIVECGADNYELDVEACTFECLPPPPPPTCDPEELELDAIVECGADNYELDILNCGFQCFPPPPEEDDCLYEVAGNNKLEDCEAAGGEFSDRDGSDHCAIPFPGIAKDGFNLLAGQSPEGCLRKQDQ